MPHNPEILIAMLKEHLTQQRYNPVVVQNYCNYASQFLQYLEKRNIAVEEATPAHVSDHLRCAVQRYRRRRGRPPAERWTSIPRSAVHAVLRLVHKQWPPEPTKLSPEDAFCRDICSDYETWLREERGLADASIKCLMWEARHFLSWCVARIDIADFSKLNTRDIDAYFDMRSPGLRRKSLKDVAERLRSLVRYLYRTGYIAADLAPQIISPMLYAYEGIPSALTDKEIAATLSAAKQDRSPAGLRDYAILTLLTAYGLRDGEIKRLRLDDIDWRADTLRVRHSKSSAVSLLPLTAPVGDAIIKYLQGGRPECDVREVFVRLRAPYKPLNRLYGVVSRKIRAAGVNPAGKRGAHAFRHARAVSLLRASVPKKVIGDLLGHRSTEATIPYLKLATEDLRAIALEIPGQEVRS